MPSQIWWLTVRSVACSGQDIQELVQAWTHGVSSDTSTEWSAQLVALQAYAARHGDSHAGFRTGDLPELARWCRKQRGAHASGVLTEDQVTQLRAVGFEFDDEAAEWARWYRELESFNREHGNVSTGPFTAHSDFYLTNWCSVQRIARRSGMLSQQRVAALDLVGFDWTGADPLS